MKTITAEVEIDFKDGKRTIEMKLKEDWEIDECEIDKVIMLNLCNGETYTGVFKGIDGQDIMIESLSSQATIGLRASFINDYFEEIKN